MFDNRYPEFKVIIEEVVETNIGDFDITVEKERCGQFFRMKAVQKSVKFNGKNHLIQTRALEIPQLYPTKVGALNKNLVISWKTILRQQLYNNHYGLTSFKRDLENFKIALQYTYETPLK